MKLEKMKGGFGVKQFIDGVIVHGFNNFEEARKDYLKENNIRMKRNIDLSPANIKKTKKRLKEQADSTKTYTRFGNLKKKQKWSKYEEQCLDKAYELYEQQFLDIFNSHIHKNDYICAEEWVAMYFYACENTLSSFEKEQGIYLVSLPAAIHIADVVAKNDKTDELKKILKDVKPAKLDNINDTVHSLPLLKKLVTVIEDRNKDHKNYSSGKEHFGEYQPHDNSNYILFRKVISLIDKDYIQRAIEDAEDLGVELFHKAISMIEKPAEEHIKLAEKADEILDKIISYETPKPKQFNPLLNPQNVLNTIDQKSSVPVYTDLAFGMLNEHNKTRRQAAELGNDCLDITLKYYYIQNFHKGPAFVDEFYDVLKNKDLNIETLDIQDPYYVIFGLLMAMDRNELFMYITAIYHQVLLSATFLLPWQIDCSKKIRELVLETIENGVKTDEFIRLNNGYKKYIKSNDEDDTETSMNMPQLIYGLTGMLLPREYLGTKTYSELLENFDVEDTEYIKIIMSLLATHKHRLSDMQDELEGKVAKAIEKAEDKITEKQNAEISDKISKLKKELNEKISEGYKLSSERDDLKEKYEKLKTDYDNDMKELAQLREYMFNLQHEENVVEEELNLPINLKKRTLVFGGHDNWVGRLKEALRGDIKYYPPKYSKSNELIANADIVYIQIKYISHTTYYWVIEYCKKFGVPFVCLNSSSSNICIKTIADNDRL